MAAFHPAQRIVEFDLIARELIGIAGSKGTPITCYSDVVLRADVVDIQAKIAETLRGFDGDLAAAGPIEGK